MELTAQATPQIGQRRTMAIAGLIIFLTALAGLFYYKWTASYKKVDSVRISGWTGKADDLTTTGVLKSTVNYFGRVWPALVFGILIGAAVRALLSPTWVATMLGQGGAARRQLMGGLAGTPLMLCSCCVTPIFTGIYERGARLGSALAVMLASPGLNLAALLLTFIVFPLNMSLARLGASLAAVFILPAILERIFGSSLKPVKLSAEAADEGPKTAREFAWRFVKNVGYLTVVTVPLIAAGVLLSSLILPASLKMSSGGAVMPLLLISAISVLVALPTFFEIPLALLLMQMGSPAAATAMLVAGPIVNLPSLFVLGRETNWKVPTGLAAGVWLLAVAAGAVTFV